MRGSTQYAYLEIQLWAAGLPVSRSYVIPFDLTEGSLYVANIPEIDNLRHEYLVEIESRGSAGPDGWLAVTVSIRNENNDPLGFQVPGAIYVKPWDVPCVVHFPPNNPTVPLYTLTMRTKSPIQFDTPDLAGNGE